MQRTQYAEQAYKALGIDRNTMIQAIEYLLEIDGGFIGQDAEARNRIAYGLSTETAIALVEDGVTMETLNLESTDFSNAVLKAMILKANGVV